MCIIVRRKTLVILLSSPIVAGNGGLFGNNRAEYHIIYITYIGVIVVVAIRVVNYHKDRLVAYLHTSHDSYAVPCIFEPSLGNNNNNTK